jgi:hypothetical protein
VCQLVRHGHGGDKTSRNCNYCGTTERGETKGHEIVTIVEPQREVMAPPVCVFCSCHEIVTIVEHHEIVTIVSSSRGRQNITKL